MDVTLVNVATGSFTPGVLSGNVFFEENVYGGGASDSHLFHFNADSTYAEEWCATSGGGRVAGRRAGAWSIDSSGNLVIVATGQATLTVTLLSDTSTGLQVVVDDGGGTPVASFIEKTVPVDPAKLPGTYRDQNGDTWVFNSNGTGSTTGGGGWGCTWSVESGIMKALFSNGYSVWFYARAGSESAPSAYTMLKVGFVELAPSGGLYSYYGGLDLVRQ